MSYDISLPPQVLCEVTYTVQPARSFRSPSTRTSRTRCCPCGRWPCRRATTRCRSACACARTWRLGWPFRRGCSSRSRAGRDDDGPQAHRPRAAQPVTLAEAKLHLRVDSSDEDALISALIVAATDDAEHLMGRAVLTQRWQLTLDASTRRRRAGSSSRPPAHPTRSPCSARPSPASSASSTCRPATACSPRWRLPSTPSPPPATTPRAWCRPGASPGPPRATCPRPCRSSSSAGTPTRPACPENIKAWIKLRVGSLYANRERWTTGRNITIAPNPFIDCLLDRYRAWVM